MITIDEMKNLVPGMFDTSDESTMYKFLELMRRAVNEIDEIYDQLGSLSDNTMFGSTLDLAAAEYGIKRTGKSETELRSELILKKGARNGSVSVPGIYAILSGLVPPEELLIIERSDPNYDNGALWDGSSQWNGTKTWSGTIYRPRSIDIDLDALTGIIDPNIQAAVESRIEELKGAGIQATVDAF